MGGWIRKVGKEQCKKRMGKIIKMGKSGETKSGERRLGGKEADT